MIELFGIVTSTVPLSLLCFTLKIFQTSFTSYNFTSTHFVLFPLLKAQFFFRDFMPFLSSSKLIFLLEYYSFSFFIFTRLLYVTLLIFVVLSILCDMPNQNGHRLTLHPGLLWTTKLCAANILVLAVRS